MNIRCRLGLHAPPTFEAVPHDDGAMLYERCPRCDRVLDVKGPHPVSWAQRHAMLRNAGLNNADATDVGMMAERRLREQRSDLAWRKLSVEYEQFLRRIMGEDDT